MSNQPDKRDQLFWNSDNRGQASFGNPVGVVLTVVVLAVVAMIGVTVLSTLGVVAMDIGVDAGTDSFDPTTGDEYVVSEHIDERPAVLEVTLTTGSGVALSGDDSYVELDSAGAFDSPNGNWTVIASGKLSDEANQQATFNLFAHDNETVTIAFSDGEWVGTYLTDDASAQVRLPADEPTNWSTVALRFDNSTDELVLVADGEISAADTLDANAVDRELQLDWAGNVDEYRFAAHPYPVGELQTLTRYPAAGTTEETSARYMLDEGEGDTSEAFYADATATLVNADWGEGVTEPSLEEDADYSVTFDPLAITTLENGFADGSPVLYVEWDDGLGAALTSMLAGVGSALQMVVILMIALVSGLVIVTVSRFR